MTMGQKIENISGNLFCLTTALTMFFLISLIAESAVSPSRAYDDIIKEISQKHGMEVSLIRSIIRVESNFNPQAVSSKGAVGLMQLMPTTALEYGVADIYDPRSNIEGGVRYLKDLIRLYQGKTDLVLAAYNAGQEAVKKFGGIPPYQETIDYIEKIKSSYNKNYIQTNSQIYKFIDKKGRVVFTNNRNYYLINRKDTEIQASGENSSNKD